MRYDNIPDELKKLNQWVCANNGSKAPMQALSNSPASTTNPTTWSSFDEAVLSVKMGFHDHIGFVFNDNGIVGIDLDDSLENGCASDLATDIYALCGTYTEVSKSGKGLHLFVKGDIPFTGRNNLAGVEMYKTSRFFIMTGEMLGISSIAENQCALDEIVDKYFPEIRAKQSTTMNPRIYNPEWDCPKGCQRVRIKPSYPTIPDGCRNICLTSLAGMMHSIGYTKGQIYRELQYANETACQPPLLDVELRMICNSVTRYQR